MTLHAIASTTNQLVSSTTASQLDAAPQLGATPQLNRQAMPQSLLEQSTLTQIRDILTIMQPRLNLYQATRSAWEAGNTNVLAAVQFDSQEALHPIDVLDPCPEVNQNLSELVGSVCLHTYDQKTIAAVLNQLTSNEVSTLRDLSLLSEESLEKSALKLIFKIFDQHPAPKLSQQVYLMARKLMAEEGDSPLQLAKFKALVYDLPVEFKAADPLLPGEPFVYFNNYKEIVEAELQLLTQNLPGTTSPLVHKDELNQQEFAFVGAGFPLTAIILHIKTGAEITLIDINEEAVENGKKLLDLCEKLGIVVPGAMTVVHSDAEDCLFFKASAEPPESTKLHHIPVTILDLASALPKEITAKVIDDCTEGDIIIRKRNVDGMPQLLYPKYDHDSIESSFKLAGVVKPPYYPANTDNDNLLMGNAGHINVNSCQVLVKQR